VSVTVRVVGADFVICAGDSMRRDAVELVQDSHEAREFVMLAGTLQDPPPSPAEQKPHAINDNMANNQLRLFDETKRPRIVRPPGAWLRSWADFFCSSKTMERIVSPSISDMQVEYFEALAKGNRAEAEWVRLRSYWCFWKALGFYRFVKNLVEMVKISKLS
jgi:hypothetical protein